MRGTRLSDLQLLCDSQRVPGIEELRAISGIEEERGRLFKPDSEQSGGGGSSLVVNTVKGSLKGIKQSILCYQLLHL